MCLHLDQTIEQLEVDLFSHYKKRGGGKQQANQQQVFSFLFRYPQALKPLLLSKTMQSVCFCVLHVQTHEKWELQRCVLSRKHPRCVPNWPQAFPVFTHTVSSLQCCFLHPCCNRDMQFMILQLQVSDTKFFRKNIPELKTKWG